MSKDNIKDSIFKKGIKSIPNVVWIMCASYSLIMVTNLFVLNFAHIDADKHINRYLEIKLNQKEATNKPNKQLELKLHSLEERLSKVEVLAHKSKGEKHE